MIASKPSNDLNGQTEGRLNHDDHHVVHDRSLIKEVTSKQAPVAWNAANSLRRILTVLIVRAERKIRTL